MSAIKVSVIVPIYNVEKYLAECLDSIVNQTLRDIEIICVNDGTTDNSAEIMEQYAQKDPRIKTITQENGGLSVARNSGLAIATGEYLFFTDSDDILELNALEKLYAISKEKDLDVLYFDHIRFYENGDPNTYFDRSAICQDYTKKIYDGVSFYRASRDGGIYSPVVWSQFFSRSFMDANKLSFYPGILHEDNLFSFQVTMTAQRAAYLPEKLYWHRMHSNSIMGTKFNERNIYGLFITLKEYLLYGLSEKHSPEKSAEIFRAYNILLEMVRRHYDSISDEAKAKLHFDDPFTDQLFQKLIYENGPDMKKSISYKVGYMLTYLPRKLLGIVRSLKEHGLSHTVKRIMQRLRPGK